MNSAIRKKPIVLCFILIGLLCSSCSSGDNKPAFQKIDEQTPKVFHTEAPTTSSTAIAGSTQEALSTPTATSTSEPVSTPIASSTPPSANTPVSVSTPIAVSTPAKEETPVLNPNQKVVKSWEEYEASDNPLIAAIPEKDIFLYAVKPEGVILYVNGIKHTYDWINITPRFILPKMYYGDFNMDGNNEIVVIPYVASGTGVGIEELHIVDTKDFNDTIFEPKSYISQLDNIVKLKASENSGEILADINIEQQTYSAKVVLGKNYISDVKVEQKAYFGNIVHFNVVDGKIKAEFVLGMSIKPAVPLYYIGIVNCDVVYSDNKFIFKNAKFTTYHKNP